MTQLDCMILEKQEALRKIQVELVELVRIKGLIEKGK
jgi:hypothetical protein